MVCTRSNHVAIKAGLTASAPYLRVAKRRLQLFSTVKEDVNPYWLTRCTGDELYSCIAKLGR